MRAAAVRASCAALCVALGATAAGQQSASVLPEWVSVDYAAIVDGRISVQSFANDVHEVFATIPEAGEYEKEESSQGQVRDAGGGRVGKGLGRTNAPAQHALYAGPLTSGGACPEPWPLPACPWPRWATWPPTACSPELKGKTNGLRL